jgi:hypothetical protein
MLVVILAPVIAYAACVTGSFGPVFFTRVEIVSNPLVSGQNGLVFLIVRRIGVNTAERVRVEIDVADEQHQVIVAKIIQREVTLQSGSTASFLEPFQTSDAVFSGYLHARTFIGDNCDLVPLRIIIVPPCPCPTALPSAILPYIRS